MHTGCIVVPRRLLCAAQQTTLLFILFISFLILILCLKERIQQQVYPSMQAVNCLFSDWALTNPFWPHAHACFSFVIFFFSSSSSSLFSFLILLLHLSLPLYLTASYSCTYPISIQYPKSKKRWLWRCCTLEKTRLTLFNLSLATYHRLITWASIQEHG